MSGIPGLGLLQWAAQVQQLVVVTGQQEEVVAEVVTVVLEVAAPAQADQGAVVKVVVEQGPGVVA